MDTRPIIYLNYYDTPFGELVLGDFEGRLCLCDWRYRRMRAAIDTRIQRGLQANFVHTQTELHLQTQAQLAEYFAGKRTTFDIPLELVGSDFQRSVWAALREIPFGKTMSYAGLSEQLGNPLAIRAVASANGANAHSIIVPCHRVIGSRGELTGYAGGLSAKRHLLQLEGINIAQQTSLFD